MNEHFGQLHRVVESDATLWKSHRTFFSPRTEIKELKFKNVCFFLFLQRFVYQ